MYPALSVLQTMKNEPQAATPEFLWVGGEGGMEAELVKREGIPFTAIPSAGVHGVGLKRLPGNLWRLWRGYLASRRILRSFQPDVLFFTGGYMAVPMAFASWLGHIGKRILYVPDLEPGLALKVLARLADAIALTAESSRACFSQSAPLTVTGYPLRPGLDSWSRAEALQVFGLNSDLPVLLVTGGSRGSRSINHALLAGLPQLLPVMQILHISGQLDFSELEAASRSLPQDMARNYHLFPYLHHEMGAALRVADLAVMRAGASTLGELPLFGLPAILVPYPYAWRYQKVNAASLVEQGAAVVLEDAHLPLQLVPLVNRLISDEPRRQSMRAALLKLARPKASAEIAGLLVQLAAQPPKLDHKKVLLLG